MASGKVYLRSMGSALPKAVKKDSPSKGLKPLDVSLVSLVLFVRLVGCEMSTIKRFEDIKSGKAQKEQTNKTN